MHLQFKCQISILFHPLFKSLFPNWSERQSNRETFSSKNIFWNNIKKEKINKMVFSESGTADTGIEIK